MYILEIPNNDGTFEIFEADTKSGLQDKLIAAYGYTAVPLNWNKLDAAIGHLARTVGNDYFTDTFNLSVR